MNLVCISIIADKHYNSPTLGKRRLVECGKPMNLINEFIWVCSEGHKRIWPPQEIDRKKSNMLIVQDPLKRVVVHQRLAFYREPLQFLIYIRSCEHQIHDF
jgi:hypothetical protein